MKHAKKPTKAEKIRKKNRKRRKRLKVLLILFVFALAGAAITVYRDYQARPGFLENIWISDRGADYITVAWERPRNVYRYVVTYNGETVNVSGRRKNVKLTGLDADTEYKISVRADSRDREGFEELEELARTKKTQTIEGDAEQIRFANRPVDLKQTAVTSLSYVPGKGYKVTEDGKVIFTSSGTITVTAEASETEEYGAASKEIQVEVLDTVSVNPAGAKPHIFYRLNKDNCVCVMRVEGVEEAYTPQSFVRHDGKYVIVFVKLAETQRIITFGDGKKVYEPEQPLGHANGLTIANGKCYLIRGKANCITFDPPSNNFSSFELHGNTSGIAYDGINNMFYTNARRELTVYDSNFNYVKSMDSVVRKDKYYVQDCGAYGEILMSCISGEDYMGTNYIDFYDMQSSTYLGSVECELNELEGILVDEEGYIELLCNARGKSEYIWKTPINMEELYDG